jgi:cobalt/nickel transport system permease protein
MITEPFSSGDSIIHRIDPRLRILFAAAISFILAVSMAFQTLIAGLVLSFFLIGIARLSWREVLRRVAVVLGFIVLIWLVLPLTFEGETISQIGPLKVMRPGIVLSAQITLKSITILLVFIASIATMTIATLGHALNTLRLPDKLVFLLFITYRYFFVIEQEYHRLLTAAKIRGFRSRTNMHTYKTFAYLVGMLFVRASDRAERVHQAMKCRGFNGKFYSLYTFAPHRRNVIFSSIMCVIIFSLFILEWGDKI